METRSIKEQYDDLLSEINRLEALMQIQSEHLTKLKTKRDNFRKGLGLTDETNIAKFIEEAKPLVQ